jgi:GntR family transcriptional regulator / MocR family aminotransferase
MTRTIKTAEIMWPRLFRRFETGSSTLQGQLRDMLVHCMMEGFLQPGQALPSSRVLAHELKLSRTTVVLALDSLVNKGLIEGRSRSGFYVSEKIKTTYLGAKQRSQEAPETSAIDWPSRLRMQPSLQSNIEKPANWQSYPYPFIYGQFDASLFPRADWRECVMESLEARALKQWAPDHISRDDASLVEQIHSRLLPARGIWAERDEILITTGAQQAMFLLCQLLIGSQTVVGMENPGYPDARNNILLRTRHLKYLKVDDQGLMITPSLQGCEYIYVTPSHQCPTTVTMPLERRQQLLALAREQGIVLFEDDHESELNFSGNPTPALKSLDTHANVIYMGSLSKTLAHGLRLGYLVAPAALIKELRALRRLAVRHVATNNQYVAAQFIAHGFQEAYVRRLNLAYRERAGLLRQALAQYAPQLEIEPSQGGSALWVKGPAGLDCRLLMSKLLDKGVFIEPGDVFYAGARRPKRFMRIGYSSIEPSAIEPGIKILSQVLKQL